MTQIGADREEREEIKMPMTMSGRSGISGPKRDPLLLSLCVSFLNLRPSASSADQFTSFCSLNRAGELPWGLERHYTAQGPEIDWTARPGSPHGSHRNGGRASPVL